MATTYKGFENNAAGTLTAELASGGLSFSLQSGEGAEFPSSGSFWVTAFIGTDTDTNEIILLDSRSTDAFTINSSGRGAQGTNDVTWPENTNIQILLTKSLLTDVQDSVNNIEDGTTTLDSVTIAGNLTVDTNTLFVDSSANRVGIGTDAPDEDIHIKSTGTATLKIETTQVDGFATIVMKNDAQTWALQGVNSDDAFAIRDTTGGATPFIIEPGADANSIVIEADGIVAMSNVRAGGGTTANTDPLVSARTGARGTFYLRDLSAGFTTGNSQKDGTGITSDDGLLRITGKSDSGSGSGPAFAVDHSVGGAVKVGIGDDSPSFTLDVNGDSRFVDDAQFDADVSVGGFFGFGAKADIEISGGTLAATGSNIGMIREGGGAGTDDLDNMTGGSDGDIVVLQAVAPSSITVRDAQGGAGQFFLEGSAAYAGPTAGSALVVQKVGNDWYERFRSNV